MRIIKVWIVTLKVFGYVWLSLASLVILAGTIGVWMKEGFGAVQELVSPFNIINYIVTIVTLAPGLGALVWAKKIGRKRVR